MKQPQKKEHDIFFEKHRRKLWTRIVSGLACIVVFVTTYALILPAITMEKNNACGLDEHMHTDECYEISEGEVHRTLVCDYAQLGIHTHLADCYGSDGQLICGIADYVVHWHNADCYDDGLLVCQLPEIFPHVHTDACYAPSEAAPAPEAHIHDKSCYELQQVLVCELPEGEGHMHSEACFAEDGSMICELEESNSHFHTENCYQAQQTLICGLEEGVPAEWQSPEGAAEPERQLICQLPEISIHTHTASCYDGSVLICGKLETYIHTHDSSCFHETLREPGEPVLICTLEEHTHTDECFAAQESETSADPTADVETAEQWEASFHDIRLTGEYRQDVLTIARSQLGYAESTRNYILTDSGEPYGYTRYGAWYGDPYGEWCAMFVSFCLHYADVPEADLVHESNCEAWLALLREQENFFEANPNPEAFSADANTSSAMQASASEQPKPYIPEPGDLIFFSNDGSGISDHVGFVTGYLPATRTDPARVETLEGNNQNAVRTAIYEATDPRILGYAKLPAQTFYCGKAGHVHTTACGMDACSSKEHIHTDECQHPALAGPMKELRHTGADYTVCVRYRADAQLPEDVALLVHEILPGTSAYETYCAQSAEHMQAENGQPQALLFARFFEIAFVSGGQRYEPAAPVCVSITYAQDVQSEENASCKAVHFATDGTELLDVQTAVQPDGRISFTHTQSSFSVVGDVVAVSYAAKNPADLGPEKLPVYYYVNIDNEWKCVGSTNTGWYGDYTTGEWTDTNRDYITVAQAESILGSYGFRASDGSGLNKKLAYQQLSINTSIYADVNTPAEKDGWQIVPLSRNERHTGYNLYYLPGNSLGFSNKPTPADLPSEAMNGSHFYTVKVFDAAGNDLLEQPALLKEGETFTFDTSATGVDSWLIVSSNQTEIKTPQNNQLTVTITGTTLISPGTQTGQGNHSVTFKVIVDGAFQTVGSLPYYYTGSVGGQNRAYITSSMAAQFFGAYGYTATEDPGTHFAYSYHDIYEIYYDQSNFCMDVTGGSIAELTKIQLYEANHSDAQTFRIRPADDGYYYITPVTNSSLHVNDYLANTNDDADIILHSATDAASQWKMVSERNNTVSFWAKNKPDSALIDLDSGKLQNGTRIHIWNNGGNRYWRLEQQYRINNNTAVARNDDGTYNIGLTEEANGDIVCYYLPAEGAKNFNNYPESGISSANSFWSVRVRDDQHAVYNAGELDGMVQYVKNGGEATITVDNAQSTVWSCVVKNGEPSVERTEEDNRTTYHLTNITGPVEIVLTSTNPTFTVQYYANILRVNRTPSDSSLTVIDTSAANNGGTPTLPKNRTQPKTNWLPLKQTNRNTTKNRGTQTPLYEVSMHTELTKMYTDGQFEYASAPGLPYFNKVKDNDSYKLTRVGVLKQGRDPASTANDDWDWYQVHDGNIEFTNTASIAQDNTVLITDGAVIRLSFEATESDYVNSTTLYDYNISSGQNSDGSWRTGITGINIEGNYGASGNGQRTWRSYADVLAFGNANCGTGMSGYEFDGSYLNKSSGKEMDKDNYGGCTFGIANSLNDNGTIRYNEWIVAPKLFNNGDAQYKQTYAGSSLTFDRVGDTYTLSSATLKNSNGQLNTVSDLQYFFHPSPSAETIHTHIFTNDFWPMDQAAGKTDPLFGEFGNPVQFQGFTEGAGSWADLHGDFPVSDDGNAHNSFFGMHFSIGFTLTDDYVGPLKYEFFGDDDLWVFLDGRLVCDIGGVHSSVGEYVDLRDYLPVGGANTAGQHTLTFFYTERGASGSTCWMQFILPSVTSATTARDTGSLQISKKLEGVPDSADYSQEEYEFQIELLSVENGNPISGVYSSTITDSKSKESYGVIKSGSSIKLHANETATISGLPAGTFYRVTELTHNGYHVKVNNAEGIVASGYISDGNISPAAFINEPYHELPESGGPGVWPVYICGAALCLLSVFLWYKRRRYAQAK